MARPSNTEERRTQIVSAMQKVMASSGYAGSTIAAIARAAGLAPGLVHYHFRDKREILVALVDTLARYGRDRYDRRTAVATTARDRLRAYVDARLAYGPDAQSDAVAAWVVVAEQAIHDADVREVYQTALAAELKVVRSLLRQRYRELGHRPRRVDQLAAGILSYIEGAFVLATTARPLLPRGFAAPIAIDWIERYIAAEVTDGKS